MAPGQVDEDLPDHDPAVMSTLFSRPWPDWTDRDAVAAFAAEVAEPMSNDAEEARATTEAARRAHTRGARTCRRAPSSCMENSKASGPAAATHLRWGEWGLHLADRHIAPCDHLGRQLTAPSSYAVHG